ncbi:hypothetical protein RAS1_21490 [Phycisphaerae bacterium RAS1]|nr:hypothetical protein RAS1_21490 [Phycisphaerae bacterium RAS1]
MSPTRFAFVVMLAAGGLTARLAADEMASDREMIAKASTVRATAPARGAPASPKAEPATSGVERDELSRLERQARVDAALATAKLEMILARKALRDQAFDEAARRAAGVLRGLRAAPAAVDAGEIELQAEGVLAKAARSGVEINVIEKAIAASTEGANAATSDDPGVRAAARIARSFAGTDTDDIDTTGNEDVIRRRMAAQDSSGSLGPRPGKAVIDTESVLERDRQRIFHEGSLREAVAADEARRITEADEARLAGESWVSYPDDWPQRVARRKQWEGGQIARSSSWSDKDGREWYAAVYDVRDLIYVPPDFQTFTLDPRMELVQALDRNALRIGGQLFRGWGDDLARDIPMLRFFGPGLDDFVYRGPKYSAERQQQIVKMIEVFTGQRAAEPMVIALPPVQSAP